MGRSWGSPHPQASPQRAIEGHTIHKVGGFGVPKSVGDLGRVNRLRAEYAC